MEKFELTALEMRYIMECLFASEDSGPNELHDRLVDCGFDRFAEMKPAVLHYRDE